MPVGTADGRYYDSDEDYWHENLFGPQQTEQEPEQKDNKVYIVRHGDTELNDESTNPIHSARGWSDVPLNQDGVKDAHKAAESLKDKDITRIVSSDIPRARQTAEIIGDKLGIEPEYNPNLRTWNVGQYTGKTSTEVGDDIKRYRMDIPNEAVPGGESFNDFSKRVLTGFAQVARNNDGNTLVVTHHSPERVFQAWKDNGSTPDGSLNQDTLSQEGIPTGGSQTLRIPQAINTFNERFNATYNTDGSLNDVAKEIPYQHLGPVNQPGQAPWWATTTPRKTMGIDPSIINRPNPSNEDVYYHFPVGNSDITPSDPNAPAEFQNVMESPDEKMMQMIGAKIKGGENGGSVRFVKPSGTVIDEPANQNIPLELRSERPDTLDMLRDAFQNEKLDLRDAFENPKDLERMERWIENKSADIKQFPGGAEGSGSVSSQARYGNQNAKINLDSLRPAMERMFNEGKSIPEIADALKLNDKLVAARRNEWGLKGRQQPPDWSDKNTELLKQRLSEGKSYSDIAKELGMTKNSIIGKANRLKQ